MKKKLLLILSACTFPLIVFAQMDNTPAALRDVRGFSNILPISEGNDSMVLPISGKARADKENIIPFIKSSISEISANIISNPEQVFCYQVEKRIKDDKRYTLDGFAVKGFCGELDKGAISTTYSALFTQSPNIITTPAQCKIEPRLIVRFVKGVDYADVLLSSPCPSFTIFYGGKYKAFNIKQGVIDDIIKQLSEKVETFHSPALIKKTVANAEATSTEESETLEKKQREHETSLSEENTETETKPEESAPKSGWGNINLKFKK